MTQQAAALNYATPTATTKTKNYLPRAIGIALGVLGANTFADAAGFPPIVDADRDAGYVFLRVICGIILAVVTTYLVSASLRAVRVAAAGFSQIHGRPATAVVITLIVTGAFCLLGAIAIPLCVTHNVPSSFTVSAGGASSMRIGTQLPILSGIEVIVTSVVGAALVAVGIWGSLPAGK